MLTRSEARERLMTVLFALALRDELNDDAFIYEVQNITDDKKHDRKQDEHAHPSNVDPYIIKTGKNVIDHLEEIDFEIERFLKGWRIERLSVIDMAIMRLAVSEMLYDDEIPNGVSINEAIELAKKYSDDEAYRFINGILGSISRAKRKA